MYVVLYTIVYYKRCMHRIKIKDSNTRHKFVRSLVHVHDINKSQKTTLLKHQLHPISIRVDGHFQSALESADVHYLDCGLVHRVVPVAAAAVAFAALPVFVVGFHYSAIAFK